MSSLTNSRKVDPIQELRSKAPKELAEAWKLGWGQLVAELATSILVIGVLPSIKRALYTL